MPLLPSSAVSGVPGPALAFSLCVGCLWWPGKLVSQPCPVSSSLLSDRLAEVFFCALAVVLYNLQCTNAARFKTSKEGDTYRQPDVDNSTLERRKR